MSTNSTFTRTSPAGQGRAEGKGTIANCSHKSTITQKQFRDISCWQAPGVGLTIQTSELYTYLLIQKELLDVRPNFDRIRPNIFPQNTYHFDQQIFSLEHCGSRVVGIDTGLDSNRTHSSAPIILSSIKTHSVGLGSQQKRPTYAGTRF